MIFGMSAFCIRYVTTDRSMVKKYGLPMLVTADESLKEYLSTILSQVQGQCSPRQHDSLAGPRSCVIACENQQLILRVAPLFLNQPPRPRYKVCRNRRNHRTLAIRYPHRRSFQSEPQCQHAITGRLQTFQKASKDGKGGSGGDQGDYEANHIECDVFADSRGRV